MPRVKRRAAVGRSSRVLFWLVVVLLLVSSARIRCPSFSKRQAKASAVYTPYSLTPGGGEKVILNMVLALQRMTGGPVHLLVNKSSQCRYKRCVRQLSKQLVVNGIDWRRVRVKVLKKKRRIRGTVLEKEKRVRKYLVWVHMANHLFPMVQPLGVLSIYHCQFPFDFHDSFTPKVNEIGVVRLSGYDVVYLNSRYTSDWYMKALSAEWLAYRSRHGSAPKMPSVTHFAPPVTIRYTKHDQWSPDVFSKESLRIVLIGRFFDGSQSKHHIDAIHAVHRLKILCGCNPHLFLIGHTVHGQDAYLREVKKAAKAEPGVTLVLDAVTGRIDSILRAAHFIWSITGFGKRVTLDPADAEHFGIALLEGMSAGLIPVVARKGGPVEIVEDLPTDLTADSVEELALTTYKVFQLPHAELQLLRDAVVARSHEFDQFHGNFEMIFNMIGVKLRPENVLLWRQIAERVLDTVERYGVEVSSFDLRQHVSRVRVKYAAVYVETRYDLALRANILNLRAALGDEWAFHVWYGAENELQLKTALAGLGFVKFHALSTLQLDGDLDPRAQGSYQVLFKSTHFWERTGSVERVLTFQSDTWFHSKGFDPEWLESDYIGAPWCLEGNSVYLPPIQRPAYDVKMLHTTRQLDQGTRVGNGGLSIRNKRAMIKIIEKYANESDAQENEDVFAVTALQQSNFSVASKETASFFSLECLCHDIQWHKKIVQEWRRLNQMRLKTALHEGTKRFTFAIHKPAEVFHQLTRISGDSRSSSELFVKLFL